MGGRGYCRGEAGCGEMGRGLGRPGERERGVVFVDRGNDWESMLEHRLDELTEDAL